MPRKKNILWYCFIGSRGGETRMNIVNSLLESSKNPRQIALELGKDYSTITHSLKVLSKNRIVYCPEEGYGAEYHITPEFHGLLPQYKQLLLKNNATVKLPSAISS